MSDAPEPEPLPPYVPIGCGDYEHLEIVCMDRCSVEVVTDAGALRGRAMDTRVDGQGEFLVLAPDDGSQRAVRVDRIRRLVVLSEPRRFDEWVFGR